MTTPCNARYPSPDPSARIVECELATGHPGDHEEVSTESSWPACCPGEEAFGMHTDDCPVYVAAVERIEANSRREMQRRQPRLDGSPATGGIAGGAR